MLFALAVAAVIVVWLDARHQQAERKRIIAELEPMLQGERFFIGIKLGPGGTDTLYAFDPVTRSVANLGTLSVELLATVSPDKSKLFYLKKATGPIFTIKKLFNRSLYPANGAVIEPASKDFKTPIKYLPGKPLSVGYGDTGIWGGSSGRIFLSLLRRPPMYVPAASGSTGGRSRRAGIMHMIFDLDDPEIQIDPIPSGANLRDALFIGDDIWYASAHPDVIGLTSLDQSKFLKPNFNETINSLFQINGDQIGIISSYKSDPNIRSAIFAMTASGSDIGLRFVANSTIRKERSDPYNRRLFFLLIEYDTASDSGENLYEGSSKLFHLYSIPYEMFESGEVIDADDLSPILQVGRSGSMGYYDLDYRKRTIIYKDTTGLFEIPYDGGEPKSLWLPPDMNLQWIQLIYCH